MRAVHCTLPCPLLFLSQVQDQADGAWSYIVERRIEAPNKFAAVQTHRQVIELLAQQKQFVRELNEGGYRILGLLDQAMRAAGLPNRQRSLLCLQSP